MKIALDINKGNIVLKCNETTNVWLARNRDSVSKWSDMSTRARTVASMSYHSKNPTFKHVSLVQIRHHHHHLIEMKFVLAMI